MMDDCLKGKKLLILAGSAHQVDLARRAKELGAYVIVTDYYDAETSPAKKIADEAWDISWNDQEALQAKCEREHIDGITTGYSEFTVESMIKLCGRLGLPCYCNLHQLDTTRNKDMFKEECRKNHVPVVREYARVDDVTTFPVIVKPVDRGGSIGISVAKNRAELEKAWQYAMEMSVCKKVIIEDFIYSGTKFDAYYAISEGEITLLSSSDTINAAGNGFDKVVQSGWLYPSRYHEIFKETEDRHLRKMIENMGVRHGFFFFSGFAIPTGDTVQFVFFETGFRLSGSHLYRYLKHMGYPDIQDIFIRHALLGNTKEIAMTAFPRTQKKAAIINYYAKAGKIQKVSGLNEIAAACTDCGFILDTARIGEECSADNAILSKLAMIHFYNESPQKLQADVAMANRTYKVSDESGNDMIYDRMDDAIVGHWWDKRELN